jgi:mannose-6-phosphate isomerase-like protein (cupin superfamily)
MSTSKYAGNIVTDTKPFPPEMMEKLKEKQGSRPPPMQSSRLLWLDEQVVKGAFYMEFLWLWGLTAGPSTVEAPHQHSFTELIGFIGGDAENPYELGGEVEIRLGDENYILKKSCLVFIPKGLTHCPIQFKSIDSPILWFTMAPNGMYQRADNPAAPTLPGVTREEKHLPRKNAALTDYSRYIITEMKKGLDFPKPPQDLPTNVSPMTRLLWLDSEIASGAFYMECVWYGKGEGIGGPDPHVHDFDEVLGFIGTNRQDPHDLGGTVELWLDDEKHSLQKSCLVFVPRGMKHCPMTLKNIRTPIFHFSSGNGGTYQKKAAP